MQTFLPDPDFSVTARLLDGRRLGKQRVEAMQILRALTREPYGWKSHPAMLMWSGFEEALAAYTLAMCAEWCGRGYADTVAISVVADLTEATGIDAPRSQAELAAAGGLPSWLGDEAFHASHRSALVCKDPEHYRPLFPDVVDDQPYVWPCGRRVRRHAPKKPPGSGRVLTEVGVRLPQLVGSPWAGRAGCDPFLLTAPLEGRASSRASGHKRTTPCVLLHAGGIEWPKRLCRRLRLGSLPLPDRLTCAPPKERPERVPDPLAVLY